jgi:hypothetical protein
VKSTMTSGDITDPGRARAAMCRSASRSRCSMDVSDRSPNLRARSFTVGETAGLPGS